jgi:hypothetical protein
MELSKQVQPANIAYLSVLGQKTASQTSSVKQIIHSKTFSFPITHQHRGLEQQQVKAHQ